MTCLALAIVHTTTPTNGRLREEVTGAGLSRAMGNPENLARKVVNEFLTDGKSINEVWEEAKEFIEGHFKNTDWLVDLEYIWPRPTSL